jgi:hypothetical protein
MRICVSRSQVARQGLTNSACPDRACSRRRALRAPS